MPLVTRHSLVTVVVLAFAALLLLGVFMWSGMYNMGANDPHMKVTYKLLETMRQRSVAARASKLQIPENLDSADRIAQGAGNYSAMCTGCHLAPGMAGTELSRGLYPAPPDLTKQEVDAAEAFWVIKNGIKASGMPAWGKSMSDEYIWNMAAFLQELPKLSPAQYDAMVASSGGHEHGGGETKPHGDAKGVPDDHGNMPMEGMPMDETSTPAAHAHAPGTPAHDDAPADAHAGMDMSGATAAPKAAAHPHPPGTPADHHATESVAAPKAPAAPAPAAGEKSDDGHDHQH